MKNRIARYDFLVFNRTYRENLSEQVMAEIDYSRDTEFAKLVARNPSVNLTIAALELARDAYPDLEFEQVIQWITRIAAEIRPLLARADSEKEALEVIAQTVAVEHGIVGSSVAFEEAQGSFLNDVIRLKRGLPITLSLLYMAIGEELSIDLVGVAAPMHFIARLETIEGPVFLDGFAGNRVMTLDETVDWLSTITKWPAQQLEGCLKPASSREIVIRMLTNLKLHYAIRQDWNAAWLVMNRLHALNPADYETRRDLSFAAGRANQPGIAMRLLKSLLNHCPDDERESILKELLKAEKQLHRWN